MSPIRAFQADLLRAVDTSSSASTTDPLPYKPRWLARWLAQPADGAIRTQRAQDFAPTLPALERSGSASRQEWITYVRAFASKAADGAPWRNEDNRLLGIPGDELHDPDVATWQFAPGGQFWCTGRRDPRLRLDPGPPPFSNTPHWGCRWTGDGEVEGQGISEVWRVPCWPHTAGRYAHSTQDTSFLRNAPDDGSLIDAADGAFALSPDAIDIVIVTINDCEAISPAAVDLIAGDAADHRYPKQVLDFVRPTASPRPGDSERKPFGPLEYQRHKLDTVRTACMAHLGLAAVPLARRARGGVETRCARCLVLPVVPRSTALRRDRSLRCRQGPGGRLRPRPHEPVVSWPHTGQVQQVSAARACGQPGDGLRVLPSRSLTRAIASFHQTCVRASSRARIL